MVSDAKRAASVAPTRRIHDDVVSALPVPPWLAGDDLLQDVWTVSPSSDRKQEVFTLRFDDVISPCGGRLSDPEYEYLCTYAKVSVARSDLFARNGRTSMTAVTVALSMDKVLFRWMDHKNLRRLSELRPEHFEMFVERMSGGVFDGLLPMQQRIGAFLADVSAGRRSIASFHDNGATYLNQRAMAHELGLSSKSFGRMPGHLKFPILEYLRVNNPELYDVAVWTGSSTGRSRADQVRAPMTVGGLYSLLGPWDRMARLVPFLPGDRLSFPPFGITRTLNGLATLHGFRTAEPATSPHPPCCI